VKTKEELLDDLKAAISYVPWYQNGATMTRCELCACIVLSGDTEVHTQYHVQVAEGLLNAAGIH
jgi:hypothetical protein